MTYILNIKIVKILFFIPLLTQPDPRAETVNTARFWWGLGLARRALFK